jgi:hypothetical protein
MAENAQKINFLGSEVEFDTLFDFFSAHFNILTSGHQK